MLKLKAFVWSGEKSRRIGLYRLCPCVTCQRDPLGVGYLSASDSRGNGFTIWIKKEALFRVIQRSLRGRRPRATDVQGQRRDQGLQNIAPPKPDRIELLKQVRRATIEDQLHLLDWLEKKYAKIRPHETK